jgi:hypothetical protein
MLLCLILKMEGSRGGILYYPISPTAGKHCSAQLHSSKISATIM